MTDAPSEPRRRDLFRFSVFELDVRTGELRKSGTRVRLSGQPLKILERLIARPGELVTREELQQELWSDDTFVDFERNLNSAIKRLRTSLGDSAEVPRFIETLPRRGYRFLVAVEHVVDPAAADVRAIEEDAAQGEKSRVVRQRAVWPAATATLALIVAAALVYTAWPERPRDFRTIAVLPFVLANTDSSADEYVAFGLAEALSKELSRFDRLRVISQTSSQRYKGTDKTLPQIAAELGVEVVVEGSVQREGNSIRITVQVIEAASDTHLWAESYEREIGNVLALADEVARAVATEIHVQISPAVDEGRPTPVRPVDPTVAEAYLKGRYHLGKGTSQDFQLASSYFEQALALDPLHALSHSGLADYFVVNDALEPSEAFGKARVHALKAIELDEALPDAHASLAFVRYYVEWDWAGAEREFTRAIELNPGHARARRWYGLFLSAMGRHAEALDHVRRATAIDPIAIANLDAVAMVQGNARQFNESLAAGRSIMELDAFDSRGYEHQAIGLMQLGQHSEALALIEKSLTFAGSNTALKVLRVLALGRGARAVEAEQALSVLEEEAESQYVSPVMLSIARADLGHQARALTHLERAYAERDPYVVLLHTSPWFDSLRADARFQVLHDRLDFPD
jgi:TolB-like protein/DNA-binding winged helix-turn-helix (wHTH) protein/tetratricopeptide (TPR) repeat protein